jgi:hypothetical protein
MGRPMMKDRFVATAIGDMAERRLQQMALG